MVFCFLWNVLSIFAHINIFIGIHLFDMRNVENWKFFRKLLFSYITRHTTQVFRLLAPHWSTDARDIFDGKYACNWPYPLTHYLPLFEYSNDDDCSHLWKNAYLTIFLFRGDTTDSRHSSPYIDVICTKGKWKFIELTK